MRRLAWPIFALAVLATAYSAYAALFFAWVTATPLTPPQLAQAQFYAYVWSASAATSAVVAIIDFVFIIRRRERGSHLQGFDVVTDAPGDPAAR